MANDPTKPLRTGYTTGACATAAAAAATGRLLSGAWQEEVSILLPRGQRADFQLAVTDAGKGWAEAGIIKDAGDDPDVTHGCLVRARVERGGPGIRFFAGEGVGMITKPGLPVPVGEPAINPVPRQMMTRAVTEIADQNGAAADFDITISIPGGAEIAQKTWNPRLGIEGGLSILGTTGIVRPFSCAAWIASIHRGIDVARAMGEGHVCGATGNTSEAVAQNRLGLPDHAMLDMGDFVGGMLKYLARNPVQRLTIAGGPGKLAKLAQGASDLHSSRSQVDFATLADWLGAIGGPADAVRGANTTSEALAIAGPGLARIIADKARDSALAMWRGDDEISIDIMVVSREGDVLATSSARAVK